MASSKSRRTAGVHVRHLGHDRLTTALHINQATSSKGGVLPIVPQTCQSPLNGRNQHQQKHPINGASHVPPEKNNLHLKGWNKQETKTAPYQSWVDRPYYVPIQSSHGESSHPSAQRILARIPGRSPWQSRDVRPNQT